MGGKRKWTHYSDEFKVGTVLQLEVSGYTGKQETSRKGALSLVAKKNGISPTLARSWFIKAKDILPEKVYNDKKRTLVEAIEDEMWGILDQMGISREAASYQQLGTVFGIMTDKRQILTGGPTENINQRVMVLDFGDIPNGNGRTVPG